MAAENAFKSKEVSAMIKQGFISESALSFSPSRVSNDSATSTLSKAYSYSASPSSKAFSSPPPQLSASIKSLTRPNQTLYDMMSEEQLRDSKLSDDKRRKLNDRVFKLLEGAPFCSPDLSGFSDVRLTIVARDGFKISMDVHKNVLIDKSRFFAEKLRREQGISHSVEISDCDDVEVYVETVVLMYSDNLKKKLMGEEVSKVLGLLKVSAAILFDTGTESCLAYLESVPWSDDEEAELISTLSQLQLHTSVSEVLQRVSLQPSTSTRTDDIFLRLLSGVIQAKDEKARREMKILISRLLREGMSCSISRLDVSKDTLYHICHGCLSSIILSLSEATGLENSSGDRGVLIGKIAREAENMQWIVDILIEKKIGDEFVKLWADQKELAALHLKLPTMYRYEISRITAQLCIAIGRGKILVPKDTRFALLSTWLEALYEDFGWMKRASRSVDKKSIEDGLSHTVLTLPLPQQQAILLNWFDRFLSEGDDCPNIQKAFEVWWRRAFVGQHAKEGSGDL